MVLKGKMVNGKFVDTDGKVYKVIPPGAEIIEEDGTITPSPTKANTSQQQIYAPRYPVQILPKCISIEIREATQTKEQAQIIIRAHCRDQYADAIASHWFESQSIRAGIMVSLQTEAVESAKSLLAQLMKLEPQQPGDVTK